MGSAKTTSNSPQKIVFNGVEYPSKRAFVRFLAGDDLKLRSRLLSLFCHGYTVAAVAAAKDLPSGFLKRVQTRVINSERASKGNLLAKKGVHSGQG